METVMILAAATTAAVVRTTAPVAVTPAIVTTKAVVATSTPAAVVVTPQATSQAQVVNTPAVASATPATQESVAPSVTLAISTIHSSTASTTSSINNNSTTTSSILIINSVSPQVIPAGSDSSNSNSSTDSSNGNKSFPIAAIAVISIIGGIIVIFLSYKIYVWLHRRSQRNSEPSNPYPEARPLAGNHTNGANGGGAGGGGLNSAGSRMSMAFGNGTGEGGFGSVWHAGKRNSTMGYGSGNEMWAASSSSNLEKSYQEKDSTYDDLGLGENGGSRSDTPNSHSPGLNGPSNGGSGYHSREGSPFGREHSSTSEFGVSNNGGGYDRRSLGTFPSRNSMISSPPTQRRSLYGSPYNGPQVRSVSSTSRLSGAPHAPHSRIDIVPPLPLGPPPGSVVATDKSTIQFSSLSGIGGGLQSEEWFTNSSGQRESVLMAAGSRNPHFDGGSETAFRGNGYNNNNETSSLHSFPPHSSNIVRGRENRISSSNAPIYSTNGNNNNNNLYQSQSQPQLQHSPTQAESISTTSEQSYSPSSSTSRLPLQSSQSRQSLPPLNTNPSAFQAVAASPLEKLQQRMLQEAHRDAKARERTDRVRRANEGDDGTGPFSEGGNSSSNNSGSRSGGDDRLSSPDVGTFRPPSAHLEEISAPRLQ